MPSTFGVAAFCAALLSSAALAQNTNYAATTGSALPEDMVGGSIFSPDGITHIVGDGMGGGVIYGPDGSQILISNGMGGGTLYAPNSTGVIIADGMGGGILYSPKKLQASPEEEAVSSDRGNGRQVRD